MRGVFALLITIAGFAFFAATVRIHVSAPQQWVERKASIIHLAGEGEGKIWALRAKEGGPFPSRVEPGDWEKSAGNGQVVIDATRLSSAPYQSTLRDIPVQDLTAPLSIASKGERVFPKRTTKNETEAVPVATKLVPALYPLSGISFESMPTNLPEFEAPVDAAMTAVDWRFLLRLRPDGSVAECVSLADEVGGSVLAKWLRGVNFGAELARKSERIGIGIGFINQPVHGSDSR